MKDLIFPTAILEQHLVVLGKTGAGKSSALRHIVEHLLSRKKRVCVVDPKGDWYGLKSSADGKGAGFPVILFGDFKDNIKSDVPLIPRSKLDDDEVDLTPAAKHVADLVVSGNRPCVLGMRGWTQGNMTRFWIDFASTVFNGESGELYFVVDEVHNFAPKGKLQSIDAGKCLHWTNRLMNEGRGIGMVNLIASQRPQKVHNDTLTACETLVAMRVIHKADRDAVEDWIKGCGDAKQGTEVLNALAGMKRGEAYVWSPEIGFGPERLAFPMFTTFDSFAPARLQQKVKEEGWASVDLTEVRQKLAAVIERAKAEDPKEIRKKYQTEIAELRKHLAAKSPAPAKHVETIKEIEKPVLKDAQIKRLESFGDRLSTVGTQLVEVAKEITGALSKFSTNGHKPAVAARPAARAPIERTPPAPRAAQPPREISDHSLTGPEQRVLDALAWWEAINVTAPDKGQVGFIAGYRVGKNVGGTFGNILGKLRTAGLIEYPGAGTAALTDDGRAVARSPDEMPSTEALHEAIYRRLDGPERRVLEGIIEAYPERLTKQEAGQRAGYTVGDNVGGTFGNILGRLRSLGLIDYPAPGHVVALPVLFIG